jgi:anti-sigma regulatory factor (Ser/Thr protein kinase)
MQPGVPTEVGAAAGMNHRGPAHAALVGPGSPGRTALVADFVRRGLDSGEAVSIAISAAESETLRQILGDRSAQAVIFDVTELGRNPGRIIPAMLDFAAAHAGQRARYLSQPFRAGRSAAETAEAMRHEALVNLAFAQADASIVCLYDPAGLDSQVVSAIEQTHPAMYRDGQIYANARYAGPGQIPPVFNRPLTPPSSQVASVTYSDDLHTVRIHVAQHAREAGLAADRAADLVLAVNEVAANTLRHAGGSGTVQVWRSHDEVICQIQDTGQITDPLAGRSRPASIGSGHGLWVVNQVCDLVESRTGPDGTVVRMHMSFRSTPE